MSELYLSPKGPRGHIWLLEIFEKFHILCVKRRWQCAKIERLVALNLTFLPKLGAFWNTFLLFYYLEHGDNFVSFDMSLEILDAYWHQCKQSGDRSNQKWIGPKHSYSSPHGVHLHLIYVYMCENPLFNLGGGVFTFLRWIFSTI